MKHNKIFIRSVEIPVNVTDFKYLGEKQPLVVDGWRPGQPNAKRGSQCVASYFGLEPSASWYCSFIISRTHYISNDVNV